MGEMADYYADMAMQDDWKFQEDIEDELKKSNEELFKLTVESEDYLVIKIRDYFTKYSKLSDKQRFRLAEWIVLYREDQE
jgi:hypothetical protein